jgi:hypothetical protein
MIAAPTRVHVLAVASILPQEQERPGTRWTLDEIATTVCETLHIDPLRRASIWRILHEVALQPQKRADGLNSHDEDCDAQAHAIHRLYVKALEGYEQGRLGICCDEKPTCKCWSVKPPPSPRNRGGASAARMRTYAMAHTS